MALELAELVGRVMIERLGLDLRRSGGGLGAAARGWLARLGPVEGRGRGPVGLAEVGQARPARRVGLLWSAIILMAPIIGLLFWYALGPKPISGARAGGD